MRRETLAASAAAAQSELDKVRRLSREEAEERRRDAEAALETQVTRQRKALCGPTWRIQCRVFVFSVLVRACGHGSFRFSIFFAYPQPPPPPPSPATSCAATEAGVPARVDGGKRESAAGGGRRSSAGRGGEGSSGRRSCFRGMV